MRYMALACDYDGTITRDNKPDYNVLDKLRQLRASGRKVILVTGRTLQQLKEACPDLTSFDSLILENGAVLCDPTTGQRQILCAGPSVDLLSELKKSGVSDLTIGDAIVATWSPHETDVLNAIRKLGLDLQISFNRSAVMVLPPGVNKASGLLVALNTLGISKHNVVGVGDAENDHVFLSMCERAVAVANATPLVKGLVDWVLEREEADGVCDLIDQLLDDDLQRIDSQMLRSKLPIGTSDVGAVSIDAYNSRVLIAGPSRTGKSRLTYGLLERLAAEQYQFCVVDPESDYDGFPGAVTLGTTTHPPYVEHVLHALNNPINSVTVNLVGLSFAQRPAYFARLLNVLQDLRMSTGRPHWLIVEEAHHMLYPSWKHASEIAPKDFPGLLLVTIHPSELSSAIISLIDTVIATGSNGHEVINAFAEAAKLEIPHLHHVPLVRGEVLLWMRSSPATVTKVKVLPTIHEHRRHLRKYAEGDVGYQRSFYFTGPAYRLNLQASNLNIFVRIADGVDNETWLYHLNRGDYALWFEDVIKDRELAELAQSFADSRASAAQSRGAIRDFIRTRYTLPERSNLFDSELWKK